MAEQHHRPETTDPLALDSGLVVFYLRSRYPHYNANSLSAEALMAHVKSGYQHLSGRERQHPGTVALLQRYCALSGELVAIAGGSEAADRYTQLLAVALRAKAKEHEKADAGVRLSVGLAADALAEMSEAEMPSAVAANIMEQLIVEARLELQHELPMRPVQ